LTRFGSSPIKSRVERFTVAPGEPVAPPHSLSVDPHRERWVLPANVDRIIAASEIGREAPTGRPSRSDRPDCAGSTAQSVQAATGDALRARELRLPPAPAPRPCSRCRASHTRTGRPSRGRNGLLEQDALPRTYVRIEVK